jgi:hypothetical protein
MVGGTASFFNCKRDILKKYFSGMAIASPLSVTIGDRGN